MGYLRYPPCISEMIQNRAYRRIPPDCTAAHSSSLVALDDTTLEGVNRNDQKNSAKFGFPGVIDRDLHLIIRKLP